MAKLAEAGDAQAVEQQDGASAATTPRAAGLRFNRFEKLGNAGRARCADVAGVEDIFGRDVADHRAARAGARDDDRLAFELIFIRNVFALHGRRLLGRRFDGRNGILCE